MLKRGFGSAKCVFMNFQSPALLLHSTKIKDVKGGPCAVYLTA